MDMNDLLLLNCAQLVNQSRICLRTVNHVAGEGCRVTTNDPLTALLHVEPRYSNPADDPRAKEPGPR